MKIKEINYKKIAIVVASLLMIPFFGNLFWPGWNWPLSGFILFGTTLYTLGILINLAYLKFRSPIVRIFFYALIIFPFLFWWALVVSDGELISRIISWF